jgi:Ca2+-binding RTX toxin-like protein
MGQYNGTASNNVFQAYKEWDYFPFPRKVWKSWNINGKAGHDSLTGGEVSDKIYGGDGNDRIYGKGGNDQIWGEAGSDWLYGDAGNDYIVAGNGNDLLVGGDGDDRLHGNDDNDSLLGDKGNDFLSGGFGNDVLAGGAGSDELSGWYGSDTLVGYGGSLNEFDRLTGGGNADVFVLGEYYGNAYYLGAGHATIFDFNRFEGDKIRIHGNVSDYVIVNTLDLNGNGSIDTGIYRNSDLIAILNGTTNFNRNTDFVLATPPIIT